MLSVCEKIDYSFLRMNPIGFNLWLVFGIFCIISEFLLPGLVMVFIGLGSLTVVLGMQLGYLDGIYSQFITFFLSSIIYLITLRFFILRFVPSDSRKEDIDEDRQDIGSVVKVIEDILVGEIGRIEYNQSSWQARIKGGRIILKGEQATIIGRENITWVVEKL